MRLTRTHTRPGCNWWGQLELYSNQSWTRMCQYVPFGGTRHTEGGNGTISEEKGFSSDGLSVPFLCRLYKQFTSQRNRSKTDGAGTCKSIHKQIINANTDGWGTAGKSKWQERNVRLFAQIDAIKINVWHFLYGPLDSGLCKYIWE